MALTTTSLKNDMCTAYVAACTHASLHTADPSTTGANEVAGGTYARVAISWGSPSGGVVVGTATVNVPASTTTTHAGAWNASTSGTFKDKMVEVYNSQPVAGTVALTFTFTAS